MVGKLRSRADIFIFLTKFCPSCFLSSSFIGGCLPLERAIVCRQKTRLQKQEEGKRFPSRSERGNVVSRKNNPYAYMCVQEQICPHSRRKCKGGEFWGSNLNPRLCNLMTSHHSCFPIRRWLDPPGKLITFRSRLITCLVISLLNLLCLLLFFINIYAHLLRSFALVIGQNKELSRVEQITQITIMLVKHTVSFWFINAPVTYNE